MSLYDLKRSVANLHNAAKQAIAEGIDPQVPQKKSSVLDYKASKKEYQLQSVQKYLDDIKKKSALLSSLVSHEKNGAIIPQITAELEHLDLRFLQAIPQRCDKILDLLEDVAAPKEEKVTSAPKSIPADIKGEIQADLQEIDRAFKAGCYRSVTILCGRVLEAALHRKYYDATGLDILEKNPGIGLGTLIAKLIEKGVTLDPTLSQQIHLINQVRIFSVHKKQEPFLPSAAQARAMVLYTNDVLEKLFV